MPGHSSSKLRCPKGERAGRPCNRSTRRDSLFLCKRASPPKPTSRRKAAFFMENHMAASSYGEALARLLVHEGGNDDEPRDPGGRTSRGILQREWDVWRRSHPGLPADVWRAPQDQVEAVYRQNYWDALRCDDLPAGVDYAVFDYGVNSGIGRAAKVLQRLVATAVDGEVGPETIAAAKRAKAAALIEAICDERLAFLQGLRTWRPSAGAGAGACARCARPR